MITKKVLLNFNFYSVFKKYQAYNSKRCIGCFLELKPISFVYLFRDGMSNDLGTALWYSVFCFRFTDEWCFLQPAGWQGIANSDLIYPTGAHSPDVFISQWGKTFAVQLLPELALVFILQTR